MQTSVANANYFFPRFENLRANSVGKVAFLSCTDGQTRTVLRLHILRSVWEDRTFKGERERFELKIKYTTKKCSQSHCALLQFGKPASQDIKRGDSVIAKMSKRMWWKAEPLVKGRVSKRAMRVTKNLRSLPEQDGVGVYETLRRWVGSMQPVRRDMLDVLQEFDSQEERMVFFKIFEWALTESWFEATVRDYTKLIDRYGKEGRAADAERVLRDMEDQGITADVATYSVMIGVYGRAGMLDRARQVLEDIRLAGLQPDAITYNVMMTAYGNAGLPHEAEALLADMESSGVSGRQETYVVLITGYGRLGQADNAQRIFDLMHWRGFRGNLKSFTALIGAYGHAQDPENAMVVFESIRFAGLKPDDRAVAVLIDAFGKADMLCRVMEVVTDLENTGLKPGPATLTALVRWFGKVGLVEEAERVFEEMKLRGLPLSSRAYANMYAAYAQSGQPEKATSVRILMGEQGVAATKQDHSAMVEGLLAGKLYDEAQKLSTELQAQGWEPPVVMKEPLIQCQEAIC